METLFSGIKKMIYLYLFLAVFQQILPDNQYQKYVRFFSGLIFAAVVLSPILQLVKGEDLLEQIRMNELFSEMEQAKLDYSYMDEVQQQYYAEEIEEEVAQEIGSLAKKQGYTVSEVEVKVSEDLSAIEEISVQVAPENTQEGSGPEIAPVADIFQEDAVKDADQEVCRELKEAILVYFELEEGQVTVVEG